MDLEEKLRQERRQRLAAERLLEQKQAELFRANQKLGQHALALSDEIVETRQEAEALKGEKTEALEQLERANEEVFIAQRRLWASLETMQDGFAVFDSDDRLIVANKAYLVVFDGLEEVQPGISYGRILDLIVEEGIFDLEGKSGPEWKQMMLDRIRAPQIAPLTVRLWNGGFVRLTDRVTDGGDRVTLALNITETMERETALKKATHAAQEASRAKSAFLANMSHEIRTPMNGVVGMADLLADSTLTDEQRLYVETIKNSGEALLVIINDVLDYSKIEADRLKLTHEPLDLEQMIHEIAMLMQPSLAGKPVELAIDYDLFMPTKFIGDPGRMRQVLTNIIGNAVKFTTEGHVLVRVVGLMDESETAMQVHVTIEDTGIGIKAEMVDHIFGEFNQVEDERNRKFEGTGLGLAITKKLVNLMNGDIWVDSVLGEGSAFGLKVPLPLAETVPENLITQHKPLSIGIVAPPSAQRGVLERRLLALWHRVTCIDSLDGLSALAENACDVVIVSDDLASTDLPEALEATVANLPGAPAVLGMSDSPQLYGATSFDILKIPVPRAELLAALSRLQVRGGQQAENDSPAQPKAELPPEKEADGPSRVRVLAAEDNKTNRLVFQKMTKDLNIDLKMVLNGREAVEAFQDKAPDLIFMDISMPEMDGKEATRHIRAFEEEHGLARTPIIAMTAHAMTGDKDDILSQGLDHYLTKPLRKADIRQMIEANAPEGRAPVFAEGEDTAVA